MTKRRWIVILIIILVAAVGVVAFMNYQRTQAAAALSKYQTVKLQRGDLTAVVGGTGTVRANQSTYVNWQISGRIAAINVAEGDQVKAGQRLASLAEDSLPQSVISAQGDLVTAQRSLDDLKTSNTARAQAQLTLAQAQKALDDAKDKRTYKDYQRASDAQVNQLEAEYILAQQGVENAQRLYEGVAARPADDPARATYLSQLATAQQKRDHALANLNYAKARPDANEVAQADANVAVAQANLAKAQSEWDRLKNGPDPKDVEAAQARVDALKAALGMVDIEVPFDGTVTEVDSMVGDQVSPATASFRIDDLSRLLVDVQITEVDINQVKVGQTVQLTFDAIPNKEYAGKVSEVGRVGTTSASSQGTVNFTVTIELTNPDEAVKPGMTAAVNIVTSNIPDVLLVPNRAIRTVDGKRVVYLLPSAAPAAGTGTPAAGVSTNGTGGVRARLGAGAAPQGLKMVEIKIGASSDTYSQLTSGDLKEGDQVVLNPPAQSSFGPGGGGPGAAGPGGGGG
jgi:HlyD family secretion protein